jgi:hypothetical protein
VDRNRFDDDDDPDPIFHFDADPDPDSDSHQNDANPHADPKFYTCGKIEREKKLHFI